MDGLYWFLIRGTCCFTSRCWIPCFSESIFTRSTTRISAHRPSVCSARDRFMRPGGLMVPSQTRIMLAGMTGERMYDEAFGFWDEVYGKSLVCVYTEVRSAELMRKVVRLRDRL
jgi:hypothetical protein